MKIIICTILQIKKNESRFEIEVKIKENGKYNFQKTDKLFFHSNNYIGLPSSSLLLEYYFIVDLNSIIIYILDCKIHDFPFLDSLFTNVSVLYKYEGKYLFKNFIFYK